MGIEQLVFAKLQQLSEEQCHAVLKYMDYLLVSPPSSRFQIFPQTNVEDGVGCVNYTGKPKSLEEIQLGIEMMAKQQWQQEDRK
jgi:hypothetical protein